MEAPPANPPPPRQPRQAPAGVVLSGLAAVAQLLVPPATGPVRRVRFKSVCRRVLWPHQREVRLTLASRGGESRRPRVTGLYLGHLPVVTLYLVGPSGLPRHLGAL